jgi:8-oxo-dGTP diphosphatase
MPRLPDGQELSLAPIVVAAAIVERDGRFLLTRRQQGVHLEGLWEFPGGKCEALESLDECLCRELAEELAVDVTVLEEVFTVTHEYPDRAVELHFFRCELRGDPAPQLGQEMRWVPRAELPELEFPPADRELLAKLSIEK